MKFKLILICVFILGTSFNNSYRPSMPFISISSVDSLRNITGVERGKGKVVAIYTFLQCPPCKALSRKLNRKISNGKIGANKVLFINTIPMDSINIKAYIKKSNYKSPYYLTKSPYFDVKDSYPIVVYYDSTGTLESKSSGLYLNTVSIIREYLRE